MNGFSVLRMYLTLDTEDVMEGIGTYAMDCKHLAL
jgi:hypothetical protein